MKVAIEAKGRAWWDHTSSIMWAAMQAFAKRKMSPLDLNPWHTKTAPSQIEAAPDAIKALDVFLPPDQR